MKYTVKMIKIPIELYNNLMQANENILNGNNDNDLMEYSSHPENKPIKLAHKNMNLISKNAKMPADIKQLHYNQAFKRSQKFSRDKEEKPVNVRVQNLSDLAPINFHEPTTQSTTGTKSITSNSRSVLESENEELSDAENTFMTDDVTQG